MKIHRIGAIVMRHIYFFPKSFDRITDLFFWPILDLALWGLSSQWLSNSATTQSSIVLAILSALVFWRVLWNSNYEVGVNLLEECWNKNLSNYACSPLTKGEWLVGNLIVGFLKLLLLVPSMGLAIWVFYKLNIFALGWMWIPYFASLMIFGWCVGFFASGLVLYFGMRGQALSWTLAFLFSPLCAVYFPVSYLPAWLQPIAKALPPSYIFEGMRALVLNGEAPPSYLVISFILNILFLVGSLFWFNLMYERARNSGFDHLE